MKKVVSAAKVAEFKKAFDELNKGNRIFVNIYEIRRSLNWSREEFDEMLRVLRDADIIQMHVGDSSIVTLDERTDGFTDENGFYMGTVTFNNNAEIRDIEIEAKNSSTINVTNGVIKVSEFKALFKELDKGRIFVRICDLRRKAELSRKVFDEMLKKLRDAEVIQIHEGDNSTMTADERADCFTDENGFQMGTVTLNDRATVSEIQIETQEVEVVDDFDYAKLTVKELKELAKFKKIRGYSKMRKAQLVAIFKGEIEAPKPETKYTVKLLREVAKDRGIKGYSRMRKIELIAALAA